MLRAKCLSINICNGVTAFSGMGRYGRMKDEDSKRRDRLPNPGLIRPNPTYSDLFRPIPDDVAPMELCLVLLLMIYKDFAPTALAERKNLPDMESSKSLRPFTLSFPRMTLPIRPVFAYTDGEE